MERRHRPDLALARVEGEPAPPRFGDPFLDAKQSLRGWASQTHQDVGIREFDLTLDEWQAYLQFLRRRCAIAGRPPGTMLAI